MIDGGPLVRLRRPPLPAFSIAQYARAVPSHLKLATYGPVGACSMIAFGAFRYDSESRLLYRGDEELLLPPRLVAVLESLLKRPGKIVPKEDLLASAWEGAFVGEDSLTQAISQLRQVLGDDPQRPTYIQTIPRRGYRLIAAVSAPLRGDGISAEEVGRDAAAGPRSDATIDASGRRPVGWRRALPWGMALAGATAGGLATWLAVRPIPPVPLQKASTEITLSPETLAGAGSNLLVSPGGRDLVYVGEAVGRRQLYRRPIERFEATPIDGTDGGYRPFFSPDGQWVAFNVGTSLKKVSLRGGQPRRLCDDCVSELTTGTWSPDGATIVFAKDGSLWEIDASGVAEPRKIADPDLNRDEWQYLRPDFLPGGDAVVLEVRVGGTGPAHSRLAVLSLKEGVVQDLGHAGTDPTYVETGHVLFAQGTALWALPFDIRTKKVMADPVLVLDDVLVYGRGAAQFSVSRGGLLAYGVAETPERRLSWYDLDGSAEVIASARPGAWYLTPRISPDGQRVALAIADGAATPSLFTYTIANDVLDPFMAGAVAPEWSPDGEWLYFSLNIDGDRDIYRRRSDRSGEAEPVLVAEGNQIVTSIHPTEPLLLYTQGNPFGDVGMAPTDGSGSSRILLGEPHDEGFAVFSPDGQWIAYASYESMTWQVRVRPLFSPGGDFQVSSPNGISPRWSPDGGGLIFRSSLGHGVWFVEDVDPGVAFVPGPPRLLPFNTRRPGLLGYGRNYDVSGDGQRILAALPAEGSTRIKIKFNWFEELMRLAPTQR
jgi:serine/threonine-protein kinase